MPNAPHTSSLPFVSTDHPGERRQRHAVPDALSVTAVPVPGRGGLGHPWGTAGATGWRLGEEADGRMGRVIHMSSVGVWAVTLGGRFAELEGALCWPDQGALAAAARRAGIRLSDMITRTGS